MIFEDRSSYDPASDPVAVIVLTVECAPGQVDHVTDYLATVANQGGVYSVEIGCDVHIPKVKVEPPKFEVLEPIEVPEPEILSPPEQPAAQEDSHAESLPADPATQGEVHGEQKMEQPDLEPQAAEVGVGSEAGGLGEPGPVDAGTDGVVAGVAGEVGAGSLERES